MKYIIEIKYILDNKKQIIELNTNNIENSMRQYGRNRQPLKWHIVKGPLK